MNKYEEVGQIRSELRIISENIGEEKEHTRLTIDVAIQLLEEYRRTLRAVKGE